MNRIEQALEAKSGLKNIDTRGIAKALQDHYGQGKMNLEELKKDLKRGCDLSWLKKAYSANPHPTGSPYQN